MSVFKIVFSPTGGTSKVADILVNEFRIFFNEPIITVDLLNADFVFSSVKIQSNDICVIAAPVFGGRIVSMATEHLSRISGNGAKAILVAVYGNREFEDALVELQDVSAAAGFQPFAGISAIAEHSVLRQFGAGRPDEKDAAELKSFAKQIRNHLVHDITSDLVLPGNRPYKDYVILNTKPIAGELCEKCGHCAVVCPTHAIPKDFPDQTYNDLCISCMRCATFCPKKARYIRPNVAAMLNEKLSKVASVRKPNKLYI